MTAQRDGDEGVGGEVHAVDASVLGVGEQQELTRLLGCWGKLELLIVVLVVVVAVDGEV